MIEEKLFAAFYVYLDELSFYDEYQIGANTLNVDITFRPQALIEKITIPISIHKFEQIEPADLGIVNTPLNPTNGQLWFNNI